MLSCWSMDSLGSPLDAERECLGSSAIDPPAPALECEKALHARARCPNWRSGLAALAPALLGPCFAFGLGELAADDVDLVGDLEAPFEDRDRLIGATAEPQRVAEIEERVGVFEVFAFRWEGPHRLFEDRDRLFVLARLDHFEAFLIE